MEKHRMFLAFPVSQDVRDEAEKAQKELRERNMEQKIVWVDPELFHVTVHFFGDVTEADRQNIESIVSATAGDFRPFKYWLTGLGAFPNPAHPNILTIGVDEDGAVGKSLEERLRRGFMEEGLLKDDRKRWSPHITIGRNKSFQAVDGLKTVAVKQTVWTVEEIVLMKSDLLPQGPKYTAVKIFRLGG